MNEHDMKIGQINAVIYASEEVISQTAFTDQATVLMAKEVAYDQIKKILKERKGGKQE